MENIIGYFLCFLIEGIVLWQYAATLFIPKYSRQKRILCLISSYSFLFLLSLLGKMWLNCLSFVCITFIYLVSLYKLSWYSALFHSIVFEALVGLCELPIYSLMSCFLPNYDIQMSGPHNKILFALFSKTLFLFFMYFLIHILKNRQNRLQQYDKSVFALFLIPIATLFIILLLFHICDSPTMTAYQNRLITLSAFFLLFVNLLIFSLNQYNQKKHLEFTEMQLQLQKEHDSAEYYKMLIAQNENQRILIHDMKKHLQSIALLNEENQNEKISAYINQLMHSSDLMEFSKICDHKMLNNILCRYKKVCNELHITLHADIRSNTTTFLPDSDVTSLFCNLLDNAVEASTHIKDAYIEINAAKREHTPFIIITMINSCASNPFAPNGKLVSSKPAPQAHGFGIKSIEKIVHKYDGNMQLYYEESSYTFHTIIMLKRNE